jgi:hypothetical protein
MAEADFAADQPGSSTTTPIPEDAVALTDHLEIELFEGKRRHIEFAGEAMALTVWYQGQIARSEKERTGPLDLQPTPAGGYHVEAQAVLLYWQR